MKKRILEITANVNIKPSCFFFKEELGFVRYDMGTSKKIFIVDHRYDPEIVKSAISNTKFDERGEARNKMMQVLKEPAKIHVIKKESGEEYLNLYHTDLTIQPSALFSHNFFKNTESLSSIVVDNSYWSWESFLKDVGILLLSITDDHHKIIIDHTTHTTIIGSSIRIRNE